MDTATKTLSSLKGISYASLNIRSLYRSIDEVDLLLEKSKIDFLLLQETFLNNHISDGEISIKGYNFVRQDRQETSGKKSGGGIITYIRNGITHKIVNELSLCTPHIEVSWIKMLLKDTRDTYVANVYMPPKVTQNLHMIHSGNI